MPEFVHLHLHTNYSLLDSMVSIKKLCKKAKELNMKAVAITDHGHMMGAINFYTEAKQAGIKPIIGIEAYIAPESRSNRSTQSEIVAGTTITKYHHLVLLAKNKAGYQNLIKLASQAYLEGFYYKPRIDKDILFKNAEGIICLSACFPKGTDILTENGLMKIECIETNTMVITHDGTLQKVTCPTTRHYNGNFICIKTMGSAFDIVSTDNHRFYTIKKCNEQFPESYKKNGYNKSYYEELFKQIYQNKMTKREKSQYRFLATLQEPVWAEAKDLRETDILLMPIDSRLHEHFFLDVSHARVDRNFKTKVTKAFQTKVPMEKIEITPELLEVLGLFCAEGNYKYGALEFTFNINEDKLIQKVNNYFNKTFNIQCKINKKIKNHTAKVFVFSVEIEQIFRKWIKSGSRNKNMPEFIKHLNPDLQMFFLKGAWLGDGYYQEPTDKRNQSWKLSRMIYGCISKQLISDLTHILHRNWINPLVNTNPEHTGKDGTFHQKAYYLQISGKIAKKLSRFIYHDENLDIKIDDRRKKDIPFKYNDIYYMKQQIKKISTKPCNEQVYCLDVEKSHSFIAEGVIVHNCLAGSVPRLIRANRLDEAKDEMLEYKSVFGKDYYFEIMRHGIEDQRVVNEIGIKLAKSLDIPIVATNDVHYINKEDAELHKIILNIQSKNTPETQREYETEEFYFKTADEMSQCFSDIPEAIENANTIAELCNFDYEFDKFHFPKVSIPDNSTEGQYLTELAWEGFAKRYPNEARDSDKGKRLEYELGVIVKMGFPAYFLVVRDFTVHAKDVLNMEVGCARGSVGGSIVAYCLRITEIDPIKYDLMFERFLNPERVSMPDIDMDFPESRRHEVIQYVTDKYGEECVSQINTVNFIKARTAIRDVGRVLNVPLDKIDKFAKAMPATIGLHDVTNDEPDDPPLLKDAKRVVQELINNDQEIQNVYRLACGIEGTPRHVGVHAAGVVIADQAIYEYVPMAKEKDSVTTQFDMNVLEKLGLLKMDFLGLRTLDVIRGAVDLIRQRHGIEIDVNNLPMDDEKTCTMLSEGHTKGVFQCDSSGICKLIKEIAPKSMFDCVPIVALYRPGPLESGMVQTYLDCRHGKKEIELFYPSLKELTNPTYGILLFQEQIMSASQIMCGFSIGEADELRKAIGKKNPEKLAKLRKKFVEGAKKINPQDPNIENTANEIYNKIEFFGRYCFNKAHSAAYGLIMWQTAYLKANYPTDYMCSLLTSVMGRDKQFVAYLREARRMGIKILPPNINHSIANFHIIEDNVLLFGLAGIKGVSETTVEEIIKARQDGDFLSFFNFLERCKINSGVIKALVLAGALDKFGFTRKTLYEKLDGNILKRIAIVRKEQEIGQISMFDDEENTDAQYGKMINLPEYDEKDVLSNERDLMGAYLSKHPLDRYHDWLANVVDLQPISKLIEMQDGQAVVVACNITQIKVITTKKGESMAFISVEDKSGEVEAVVFSSVYTNFQNTLMQDRAVLLESYVQMDEVENEQEEVTAKEAKLIVVGVVNVEKVIKANKFYIPSSDYLMCKQKKYKKNPKAKNNNQTVKPIVIPTQQTMPKKLRILLHPDNIPILTQAMQERYAPGIVEIEICIGKSNSAGIVVSLPLTIDLRAMESIFQIKGLSCQAYY